MSTEIDAKQAQWQKLFGYILGNQAAWIADISAMNRTSRFCGLGHNEALQLLCAQLVRGLSGRAVTALALPLYVLIHPIAWKYNSRKFISTILHSPGPKGPETPDRPGPVPNPKPYILWCCMKMRLHEWDVSSR
jgi:hypothetical protein